MKKNRFKSFGSRQTTNEYKKRYGTDTNKPNAHINQYAIKKSYKKPH